MPSRGVRVLEDFNAWLREVPCGERVVGGGNHDAVLLGLGEAAPGILSAAELLQDSSVHLPRSGLRVYGHGHSEGSSHNRAWQGTMLEVSEACAGADVVVTHHCSSRIQEQVMARTHPRVWASGHLQEHHGPSDAALAATVDISHSPS